MDNDKITGKVVVAGSGNQGFSKAAMSALTVPLLVSALSPSPYMDMMPRFRSRGRPPIRFLAARVAERNTRRCIGMVRGMSAHSVRREGNSHEAN